MRHDIHDIKTTLRTLSSRVDEIDAKTNLLEERCKKLEVDKEDAYQNCKSSEICPDEFCSEAALRHQKRKYLVMTGLSEQTTGTVKEREEMDRRLIEEITKSIGVENFLPTHVSRIGGLSGPKARLLRFKCNNESEKFNILRKARGLKNHTRFSGVYINPDLTYEQRRNSRKLRNELKERRLAGENVSIRKGRLVKVNDNGQNFQRDF